MPKHVQKFQNKQNTVLILRYALLTYCYWVNAFPNSSGKTKAVWKIEAFPNLVSGSLYQLWSALLIHPSLFKDI